MNVTSKSRYAIKILMDLAYHADQKHMQRRDIAKRQGVPTDYLDQIMVRLKRANLVKSIRGRGGGYTLAKPASDITVWNLFAAVEDHFYPVECLEHEDLCSFEESCISKQVWCNVHNELRVTLEKMTLSSIVEEWAAPHHLCPVGGIKECRHGGQVNETVREPAPIKES